jgi:hypothetical protein
MHPPRLLLAMAVSAITAAMFPADAQLTRSRNPAAFQPTHQLPSSVSDFRKISEARDSDMSGSILARYTATDDLSADVMLYPIAESTADTVAQRQAARRELRAAVAATRRDTSARSRGNEAVAEKSFRITGPTGHSVFGARTVSDQGEARSSRAIYVVVVGDRALRVLATRPSDDYDAGKRDRIRDLAYGLAVALDLSNSH